jgi:glycine cleavage system H protein
VADYPQDLKYTKDHEWTRIDGKSVTIGITAYAQESLGDVVYVELPEVGSQIKAGQPFGVVESTKAVSELFAPLSGKVVERNDAVVDSPETVNNEPYAAGWMIRIEAEDEGEFATLLDQAAYAAFVAEQG